jgi:hypothetical protein
MINQRALILDKIKQIQVKYNSKTFDTENRHNMTASVSNPKKKRQNTENSYNHTVLSLGFISKLAEKNKQIFNN